jgi:hypothetical protein
MTIRSVFKVRGTADPNQRDGSTLATHVVKAADPKGGSPQQSSGRCAPRMAAGRRLSMWRLDPRGVAPRKPPQLNGQALHTGEGMLPY